VSFKAVKAIISLRRTDNSC